MDYSTFNLNNFFIKKDSTLPELKFPLVQRLREKYDLTDDMMEDVAVTFSMMDADTGIYHIANVPANLVVNNDRPGYPDEIKYTLVYRFTLRDTKKAGRFLGEFVVDILSEGHCGKIKLPVNEYINIIISDSLTKTTVI
jgi:hypothetical protein